MKIELRRLTENELELMRLWRNSEAISSHMFSEGQITKEQQQNWFEKVSKDPTQIRWVIYYNNKPIGSMYLVDIDTKNKRCESGWFIAEKEGLPFTLPITLQRNSFDYIFNILKLNRVYGYVIGGNDGLLKLLKMCGLKIEGVMKEHARKDGKYVDVHIVGLTNTDWNEEKRKLRYEVIEIE